jgi:DNA-binding response OmpR family regulator
MLTAKDGIADEVEGLDTGADDYLSKPFSYAVLIARLRALLRRGARPRPTVLEVGDLRLDPAARRVRLGGVEIPFTAREFAVLEFFVHHPDEVLAKKDILDHVWDFDFDDPNIVEVYVRRLRAKLQLDQGRGDRNHSWRRVPAGRRSCSRLKQSDPEPPPRRRSSSASPSWWAQRR